MADNKVQLVIEAINKADTAFQRLKSQFRDAARDVDNFKLKLGDIKGHLNTLVAGFSLYKMVSTLRSSIDEAEKMQNAFRGLAAVARFAGEEIGASINAASKLAEDGLIDVREAAQALQNLLSRGFSLKESIQIIERLKDAAAFNRQAHLTMGEAVASATEGLKNENSILVDNAGVTKNVSIMWKEYAASIGKGVGELTQAEKRQAELTGIMRETEGQIGNAKLATEGLTGAKAKLNVEVIKLKTSIGETLVPAFLTLTEVINFCFDNVKKFFGGIEILSVRLAKFMQNAGLYARGIWPSLKGDKEALKALRAEAEQNDKAFDEYIESIVKKWEKKEFTPPNIKDTGRRRKDIVLPEDIKKTEEEWKKTLRDLQTDVAKLNLGFDEFDKRVEDIKNKAVDLKEKFQKMPGALKEINEWQKKMTAQIEWERQWKEYEDGLKKREDAEKRYATLMDELQTSTANEMENRIQKSVQAETKLTKELGEVWFEGVISYEEYQRRLKEIEEKGNRERAKIREEFELQALEAESRKRLALLDLAEREMTMSKESIARGRLLEYEKLLTYYEKIRQNAIEIGDITARIQAEEKINDINIKLNELNTTLKELTDTFSEGWERGLQEYLYNLETTFQMAKDIAKETAQAMQQAFSDFFFDAFEGKMKSLADYLNSFLSSVKRALANVLGQQVTGAIFRGVGSLVGGFSGGSPSTVAMDYETGIGYTLSKTYVATPIQHGGGFPHEARQFRLIPRFHTGVGPDEVLSVIRKDEAVFTQGQLKALGNAIAKPPNIKIEIHNNTGQPIKVEQQNVKVNPSEVIVPVVIDAIKRNVGGVRDILGGR